MAELDRMMTELSQGPIAEPLPTRVEAGGSVPTFDLWGANGQVRRDASSCWPT